MYTYILPEHVLEQVERAIARRRRPVKPKQTTTCPAWAAGRSSSRSTRGASSSAWSGTRSGRGPRAGRRRDHLPHLQERGCRGRRAADRARSTSRYLHSRQHPQLAKDAPGTSTRRSERSRSSTRSAMNTGSAFQEPAGGGFKPHGDGHPALQDPRSGRAIRMAVDSEEIVEKVLLGYGGPGDHDRPAGVDRRGQVGAGAGGADLVGHRRGERAPRRRRVRGHRRGRRARDAEGRWRAPGVPVLQPDRRPEHDQGRAVHVEWLEQIGIRPTSPR